MHHKTFFISLFCLALLLSFLNEVGIRFDLYWRYDWYDMLPHFVAGMCLGLTVLAGYQYLVPNWQSHETQMAMSLFTGALIVGVAWEFLELYTHVEMAQQIGYLPDTLQDLTLDMLGALCIAYTTLVHKSFV